MKKKIAIIESERLLLRGIEEADAETIVRWRSDPQVYQYFKNPHEITIEEHLNWFRKNYLNNEYRTDYICIEKDSGNKVGVFGIVRDESTMEVNYLLASEAQHKGYAREALEGMIQYARTNWNIIKVVAEIHKDNIPSIQLILRMGFNVETINDPFIVYTKTIG